MRTGDIAGKARLVTGSSRGIGAAVARIPMRPVGTAKECVGAFLFLCSAAMSGYVTGQVIAVNGGLLMPQAEAGRVTTAPRGSRATPVPGSPACRDA